MLFPEAGYPAAGYPAAGYPAGRYPIIRVAVVLGIIGSLVVLAGGGKSHADSAIPVLSGFDLQRIEASYPPTNRESLGELAKLAYRLRSLAPDTLQRLAGGDSPPSLGDVVEVEGKVLSVSKLPVPKHLVEFLEFSQLYVIDVSQTSNTARVITDSLPSGLSAEDRISAIGVVVDAPASDQPPSMEIEKKAALAIAANKIRWFPKDHQNVGQQLLSETGFDVGLLAAAGDLDRRPLLMQDADAFYGMLAAADASRQRSDLPDPITANPVTFLRSPKELVGQWVRLELESVQVTRITVTENHRQQQLGSDHYFQIDAVGDLDGVVVNIENPDDSMPAITFQGRYPVSIVTTTLPDFLRGDFQDESVAEAVVKSIRTKFSMDGFFYRLWGYETDFMERQGGGRQFGPLLMSSRFQSLEPAVDDPIGVGMIGSGAAIAILSAMAIIWWWQRRAWAGDAAARRRRQEHQSTQIRLPE